MTLVLHSQPKQIYERAESTQNIPFGFTAEQKVLRTSAHRPQSKQCVDSYCSCTRCYVMLFHTVFLFYWEVVRNGGLGQWSLDWSTEGSDAG